MTLVVALLSFVRIHPPIFKDGETALIIATLSGHASNMKVLLEAGANMEVQDKVRIFTLLHVYLTKRK
jgi:ankyrin repeat protein